MTNQWANLRKRLMISAILISICIFTIFFSPHWFFFSVVEVLIFLALSEFLEMARTKKIKIEKNLCLLFGLLLPFSVYASLQLSILFIACITFFLFYLGKRSAEHSIASVAMSIFGIVYVAWFLSYVIKLRLLPHGEAWVFFIILIVKGGDAGAYFIGKQFGRVKLIEHVSPKKSREGALGQLIATVILAMTSHYYLPSIEIYHLVIIGFTVGILAQLGDLAESLLKRDAGVKDSGNIPGLGGILDVLDSLLFTIPFLYFYLTQFAGISG